MTVPSKDKAEVFLTQFDRNSTLDSQGKQQSTIPDLDTSMSKIVLQTVYF